MALRPIIEIQIMAGKAGVPLEIERALDTVATPGTPDLATVESLVILPADRVPSVVVYQDYAVEDDAKYRHYRSRHNPPDQAPSPWTTPWVKAKPVLIDERYADPIPASSQNVLTVNGETGPAVTLDHTDVGAAAASHAHSAAALTVNIGAEGEVIKVVGGVPAWAADGGGGGGGDTREIKSATTASIANGATATGTIDLTTKTVELIKIEVDAACRVRLYPTAALRTADASRPAGTDPAYGAGLLADYDLDATTGLALLSTAPIPILLNADSPLANVVYYSVENRSGGTRTFLVSLTINL